MIFLTLGTSKYPFVRLVKAVERALLKSSTKELLTAQLGNTICDIKYNNVNVYKEIPFDKFVKLISVADRIICHGGAGTILLSLEYGRVKPFAIPRQKTENEHVDDHQSYFIKHMLNKNLVCSTDNNLAADIKRYLLGPPQSSRLQKNRRNYLIKNLIHYTQKEFSLSERA